MCYCSCWFVVLKVCLRIDCILGKKFFPHFSVFVQAVWYLFLKLKQCNKSTELKSEVISRGFQFRSENYNNHSQKQSAMGWRLWRVKQNARMTPKKNDTAEIWPLLFSIPAIGYANAIKRLRASLAERKNVKKKFTVIGRCKNIGLEKCAQNDKNKRPQVSSDSVSLKFSFLGWLTSSVPNIQIELIKKFKKDFLFCLICRLCE